MGRSQGLSILSLYIVGFLICVFSLVSFKYHFYARLLCLSMVALSVFYYIEGQSNHGILIFIVLLFCQIFDFSKKNEARLLFQYLFAIFLLFFFYTGLQKVSYASYFQGQFFTYMMAHSERFSDFMAWFVSDQEMQRVKELKGSLGPFVSQSLVVKLMSNFVYLFELLVPILIWKNWHRQGLLIVLGIFVLSIQLSAKEVFFALAFINLLALFFYKETSRYLLPLTLICLVLLCAWQAYFPSWEIRV